MEEVEKALACAMRALARRDHSRAELERKLRDRAFPAGVVALVMTRLTNSGYLDDRRFAERWAESAVRNGRGYGPRLRLELSRRGVEREIIAGVLAGIAASYGEQETLAELAAKKFAGLDPANASDRDKRRMMAYFQRRGFSTAAIVEYLRSRHSGEPLQGE